MGLSEKHNQEIFVLLSGLVIVTLPIKESLNSIAIILFLAFLSYNIIVVYRERKLKFNKHSLIFSLPFVYILIQFFYSEHEVYFRNLLRSITILLFPVGISLTTILFKASHKKILSILVYSALFFSFLLLLIAFYRQLVFSPDFSEINWYFFAYRDFVAPLGVHSSYMGMYNCLAFAVLLNEVIMRNKITKRTLSSLFLLMLVIFLTGSRISLLCLFVIFFYLMFTRFKKIDKKILTIFLLFLTIVPTVVFKTVPIAKERMIDMTFGLKEKYSYAIYGNNNNGEGTIAPRINYWKCALEITRNNILFGNGYGYTQKRLNNCYSSIGQHNYAILNYQTHNQYFNNLARGGIFSLVILFVVLFYPLFYSIRRRMPLYTSFLIIIILTCVTENILNRHFGIIFYGFFNSMFFFNHKSFANE